MKIYVEALVVIAPLFVLAVWLLFENVHRKYRSWRYKPENDKGRLGEEHRRELIRASPTATGRESRSLGSAPAPERSLFQAAVSELEGKGSSGSGKTSNSNGKVSRKFFNPFTRR